MVSSEGSAKGSARFVLSIGTGTVMIFLGKLMSSNSLDEADTSRTEKVFFPISS